MEIVSSTSEKMIERRRAIADVQNALRVMAANLLRITRGAGKPFELEDQAAAFLMATLRLAEVDHMVLPTEVYSEALAWRKVRTDGYSSQEKREVYAEDEMIAGALQMVASRLLGQLTLERNGENELYRGYRGIEAVGEERRKERAAEMKAHRTVTKRKPVKKAPARR